MTERPLRSPLDPDIIGAQRQAANPLASIWVEANAGSGKTRVLTDRVLRLMLAGIRPDQILCLTYTKAAAAEMRQRVADRLAEWALASEPGLCQALDDLTGAPPDETMCGAARKLFATALETPGGLRIQTIHAFCEAVLHRFPVEAGVPFDFGVIEDFEREQLILAARETIMAAGLKGEGPVPDAVATLFEALSDHALDAAISAALATGPKLRALLAAPQLATQRLRALVGHRKGDTSASLRAEIVENYPFDATGHAAVFALCPPDPGGSRFEDKLLALGDSPASAEALFATWLTADGAVPKTFPKKVLRDRDPDLCFRLEQEATRLERLADRLRRTRLVERSEALIALLGAIVQRYEDDKRARSLLDFDDLIARMAGLLGNAEVGPWVRYKLDGGLHHILVDESQDTNPEQWKVIDRLVADFFEPGGIEGLRTLFVVGDGKQSIYSFQGADPERYKDVGNEYVIRAQAAKVIYEKVKLNTSFRTLPGVLEAVDLVFADAERREAVLEDAEIRHRTARSDQGGTVTVWPYIQDQPPEAAGDEGWVVDAPTDTRSAVRQVAERIAGEIRAWLDAKRPLAARGRAVEAEDILVLVQSRSALFHEVIRALRRLRIPTPGADRLAVTTHIAVLDLMALGDVLLNPADDLQLGAVLRSPLFAVTDDDLMAIAGDRPDRQSLWQALATADLPSARDAHARLEAWRARLDLERPYDFFARILNAEGGLKRFHDRLGQEVDDVFAEFLDLALAHEQKPQPSLQGFLAEMRTRDVTIKRELSERAAGVRVMTVHGAKGLEAPIVILADATAKPATTQLNRPVYIAHAEGAGEVLVHLVSKDDAIAGIGDIRRASSAHQLQEYWRRLYVAMTRAEDELYLTGALTASAKPDGSWYQVVASALEAHAVVLDAPGAGLRFPRETPLPRAAKPAESTADLADAPLLLSPLPRPALIPTLAPSRLMSHGPTLEGELLATAAEAVRDAETARRSGLALHALLQHLPTIPSALRPDIARRALLALWPEGVDEHAALAGTALSILSRPEFAELFGPDSRAEVPFLAEGTRKGAKVRFAGRIDRLVVRPDSVLILDFKSDSRPPDRLEDVPKAYLAQLGLYASVAGQLFPSARLEAAILWTRLESLLNFDSAALAEAAAEFTIG
jgi:ATP-dependent helicase/nuclease subunit A